MIQLPGYTYVAPLGRPGNFGAVFHARNELSGADVAIKHIDEPMSPEAVLSWGAEATAMAACPHPNIVQIFHAEVTPDGPALVMEYLPEGSVADRYGDGPAPVDDVIRIATDVCWGLHRLHLEGLTHRDIKPKNLLISGDRVKLGDFGLARTAGDPADLVYVAHTPPEVHAGEPWTEAADIYALGATAWRLLWGDALSGRHEEDVISLAMANRWPDRDRWPLHVHKRLRTALRAALHLDASKRPTDAAQLRSSLERARPVVSWCPEGEHAWRGLGQSAAWTVEVRHAQKYIEINTARDLGAGFRRIRALCGRAKTSNQAMDLAGKVLQSVATEGLPTSGNRI